MFAVLGIKHKYFLKHDFIKQFKICGRCQNTKLAQLAQQTFSFT